MYLYRIAPEKYLDNFQGLGPVKDVHHGKKNMDDPNEVAKLEKFVERLSMRAIAMDGTCTGEHGIGMEKRNFLHDQFSEDDIDMMKRIRAAFDPQEIANRGKMFPGKEAPSLAQHGLHPLEKAGVISRE